MQYNKNLLTAIIVVMVPGEKPQFLKYRNIKDATPQLNKLETFARSIQFADHINLYYKKDRSFYKQIRLTDGNFQPSKKEAVNRPTMF